MKIIANGNFSDEDIARFQRELESNKEWPSISINSRRKRIVFTGKDCTLENVAYALREAIILSDELKNPDESGSSEGG